MSYTATDICNLANGHLGANQITVAQFTTPTDKVSELCSVHYPMCRDLLQTQYAWPWSRTRTDELSPYDQTPQFDWDYAFAKPSGCLRILNLSPAGTEYSIELVQMPSTTNIITNPGFENAGESPIVFEYWAESAPAGGTITRTTTTGQFHAGAAAAKLADGALAANSCYVYQAFTPVAEQTYELKFYTRGDGTNAGNYWIYDATHGTYIVSLTSTAITSATFSQITVEFDTPAACTSIRIGFQSPSVGSTAYACFDGVELYCAANVDIVDTARYSNIECIVTNAEEISVFYVASVTDTTVFDILYVNCVATLMAVNMAMPLTKTPALMEAAAKLHIDALRRAKVRFWEDFTERNASPDSSDTWINARN